MEERALYVRHHSELPLIVTQQWYYFEVVYLLLLKYDVIPLVRVHNF